MKRAIVSMISLLVGGILLPASTGFLFKDAHAGTAKQPETIKTQFQYSAMVVCSLLTSHNDGRLAKGSYRTVINIHNPTNRNVTFANKVALTQSLGVSPGEFSITPFKKVGLNPDGAVQLNCGNIAGFFCPIDGTCIDFAFLEGFLVIKSPVKLDVVAVYTARPTDGEVATMEVENIHPRKIEEEVEIGDEAKQCGGIAGIPCPEGKKCVDDPSDDCDPTQGGADCQGVCVTDYREKVVPYQ